MLRSSRYERDAGVKEQAARQNWLSVQHWLRWSAIALVTTGALAAITLHLRGISGIPAYYFYTQDVALLLASAATLLLISGRPLVAHRAITLPGPAVAALIGLAALFAYAGTWLVMLRYPMSRDEALAQFAAEHLQRGQLGWPIPAGLQDVSRALMPVWSDRWIASGYWVSNYLPVNSSLRALAGSIGDTWLAGPLLLAAGMAALWSSARRIWPDTSQPASVALILSLSSTQLLVNAMTPYAMTAQFGLHALWLACFLRGGRLGHGLAIAIGVLASGLHQFHFHLMFVSGFIVWAWLAKRRIVALSYVAACVGYHLVWHYGFIHLMIGTLGPVSGATPPAHSWIIQHLQRLRDLEPLTSIARFAAWQNVLLLPLAALGIVRIRLRGDKTPPITLALQLSCLLGLTTMVYQGFGYGYRYLHGLLPCFLLLAANGWVRLTRDQQGRMPRHLLAIATAVAIFVTLPFALWQSHVLLSPYARAFQMARAAPADVVLVDSRGGGFLQDIIRIDGTISRPFLMDLAYVPVPILRQLCATRRVMLFDGHQAAAVGIMGSGVGDTRDYPTQAAAQRRVLADLHCDTPVPIAS